MAYRSYKSYFFILYGKSNFSHFDPFPRDVLGTI